MDKMNWYYKQKVTEAQMDEAFDWVEAADLALALDTGADGIHSGGVVTQHSPVADLTVDVTAAVCTDKAGRRLAWDTGQHVDCAVDQYGTPTAGTLGVGKEKWVTVYALFQRTLSDPENDGNGVPVYTKEYESFALLVRQGAEATYNPGNPGGTATRPAIPVEALVVVDVLLVNTAVPPTQIVNGDLWTDRRDDWLHTVSAALGTFRKGIARTAIVDLFGLLSSHVAPGGSPQHASVDIAHAWSTGPAEAWADGDVLTSTHVQAALREIVDDLAAKGAGASEGATRVGTKDHATVSITWANATVQTVLAGIADLLNDHLVGSIKHPADDVTFTPAGWVAATDVQAALAELMSDLDLETGPGTSGISLLGAEAQTGTAGRNLVAGSLLAQVTQLLGWANAAAFRAADELISGKWHFDDFVRLDIAELDMAWTRSAQGGALSGLMDIESFGSREWADKSWAHAWGPDVGNSVYGKFAVDAPASLRDVCSGYLTASYATTGSVAYAVADNFLGVILLENLADGRISYTKVTLGIDPNDHPIAVCYNRHTYLEPGALVIMCHRTTAGAEHAVVYCFNDDETLRWKKELHATYGEMEALVGGTYPGDTNDWFRNRLAPVGTNYVAAVFAGEAVSAGPVGKIVWRFALDDGAYVHGIGNETVIGATPTGALCSDGDDLTDGRIYFATMGGGGSRARWAAVPNCGQPAGTQIDPLFNAVRVHWDCLWDGVYTHWVMGASTDPGTIDIYIHCKEMLPHVGAAADAWSKEYSIPNTSEQEHWVPSLAFDGLRIWVKYTPTQTLKAYGDEGFQNPMVTSYPAGSVLWGSPARVPPGAIYPLYFPSVAAGFSGPIIPVLGGMGRIALVRDYLISIVAWAGVANSGSTRIMSGLASTAQRT
jgi:hypothetical protein